jgi:purine-nucleoside phosphorylase
MNREPTPQSAAAALKHLSKLRPTLAIVLGSGFQPAAALMQVDAEIACAKIPGFPAPAVKGHAGRFLFGKLGGVPVIVLSGRAHFYEGHSMERITFPMHTLAAFGIRDVLLTNAAGGINRAFRQGDFMVLTDHINFMGANPLRGGPHFTDMTHVYDTGLSSLMAKAARECKIKLRRGVYLAVSGPSYETPAEIRAFAKLGADAVGMSTVPEAIVARHCGLNVAAISCITNAAAGLGGTLSHGEVLETAGRAAKPGAALLKCFAEVYGKNKS